MLTARETIADSRRLSKLLRRCSGLHAVPSLMKRILELASVEDYGLSDWAGEVRRVFVGGEEVPWSLLKSMRQVFPSASIHVLYGPTECSIVCAGSELEDLSGHEGRAMLGRPLGPLRLSVVDSSLRLAPIGVPGELCASGSGLSRGYLNRVELTAEKFVSNPFSGEGPAGDTLAGSRLYLTGDRARWHGDGGLEYLGRLDEQVKIRGFRVEIGEVENALAKVVGVREAVIAQKKLNGEVALVAYFIAETELTKSTLRDELKLSLPAYMLPSCFVELDVFPQTSSGKLDRRALPEPDENSLARRKFAAPSTDAEKRLVAIWQDSLGVEKVGVNDNFFDLGGDSLGAIKCLDRINDKMGVEIQIEALVAGSLGEIAASCEEFVPCEGE